MDIEIIFLCSTKGLRLNLIFSVSNRGRSRFRWSGMRVFQSAINRNLSFSHLIYIEQFLVMKAEKKSLFLAKRHLLTIWSFLY